MNDIRTLEFINTVSYLKHMRNYVTYNVTLSFQKLDSGPLFHRGSVNFASPDLMEATTGSQHSRKTEQRLKIWKREN